MIHHKKITIALCIPIIMACIDVMALSVGLNVIVKEFSTPIYQTQWLFTAYMIANSAFLIVIGRLADMYGRRRYLLIGIAGFTIASLIAVCSFNFWLLVAARAMQGLASAAIVTTSISLITHNFGLPERTQIFAKWVFAVGFGLAFGPLIGGLIIYAVNWRFIFLINLPIGLISYWLVKHYIDESKSEIHLEKSQLLNAFCLCIVTFFISIFLSQGGSWGWLSTSTLSVILAFLISLSLFIYLEKKNHYSTMYWHLYREKSFIIGLVSGFFSYFFMYAWLFIFSLYLQEVRGLSPLNASIILISYSIAFAFGPIFINKYYKNIENCNFIKLSFFCAAISFFLMSLNPNAISYLLLMIAFFILGFSVAVINVSSMALATKDIPKNASGVVSGIIFTVRWLGGALGVVIITIIFNAVSVYHLKAQLSGAQYLSITDGMSKIISSGHIADIKTHYIMQADELYSIAANSVAMGISFSVITLAVFAVICFILISILSASKIKETYVC